MGENLSNLTNGAYLGLIITTLGILVTVLIGWQIYSALSIERRVKKRLKKTEKKFTDKLSGQIDAKTKEFDKKLQSAIGEAFGSSLFNLGVSVYYSGDYGSSVGFFIKALDGINDSDMDKKEVHISRCLDYIELAIDNIKNGDKTYNVLKDGAEASIRMLRKIDNSRVDAIIRFLSDILNEKEGSLRDV
ncbi:MAG: hypothetical protein LBU37_10620 [Tannerellaceae bacterium]|jgi:hypothetical protein|nr:hypothetical protein [Tannerellaceae bacterium]